MYRGFPVGQLMFWENTEEDHSRTIGATDKTQTATMKVIDGQQRLTALFAVVKGLEIVREDYGQEKIVVSFNPLTESFAIPDSATKRSPEWIQDIKDVFMSPIDARSAYLDRLEIARGGSRLDRDLEKAIEVAVNRLALLLSYQFQVVQLKSSVSREVVADICVRINSENVKLSSSNF